ncbi:LysR substrate-binding domain-containing protein [Cytobacillus sp. FSL R5-0596]|uniref:LysR substrate-binding domain-containing protein n=1 Tax=Cytobacillus sp. FSL R5-0596 TaxID=2954696 RepID=UPI0030F672D0
MEASLHVGASLTIGEYILPELLGKFMKKHPNIKFNLSLGNTNDMLSKLKHNEIDIALVEGILERDKEDGELTVEKFAEDQLILITPVDCKWKNRDDINLEELKDEKLIWREASSGTRITVENHLKDYDFFQDIHVFMELGSMQSIKGSVEAGLGISIMPKLTVKKELSFGILHQVKIRDFYLKRELYLVQKKKRFRKVGLSSFAKFIRTNPIIHDL